MRDRIVYILKSLRSSYKLSKYHDRNNNLNGMAAELIRHTHSIEKGLSINNIKLGFGHQKQEKMMALIKKLETINSDYYRETIQMAISALNEYLEFHDRNNYTDDFIKTIKKFVDERKNYIDSINYGGTLEFDSNDLKFDVEEIERFIKSRHSVRIFSNKPVDDKVLKNAIELAQRCPSACNRQGVRTYVIDKSKGKNVINQLSGVGGFSDSVDKIIIVTGKVSSYSYSEINQFIVSASIFAGYLSLTLHLYGLGSCIIQRPVIWNKKGEMIKKEFNIENDEQIVCMIGVGNVEGKFKVPISHRINIDEFSKFIG